MHRAQVSCVARIAAPVRARRTFQNTNTSPLFRRNDCRDQPGLSALRISVIDTGSGVPESSREQLFNAMGKDAIDDNIKQAGTGLGLHLVRKLAEMMHGEVGYAPAEEGSGSVFWFEVKLRHSIKADRFADGEQMSVSSRRLRILVGESDPALRSVLLGY